LCCNLFFFENFVHFFLVDFFILCGYYHLILFVLFLLYQDLDLRRVIPFKLAEVALLPLLLVFNLVEDHSVDVFKLAKDVVEKLEFVDKLAGLGLENLHLLVFAGYQQHRVSLELEHEHLVDKVRHGWHLFNFEIYRHAVVHLGEGLRLRNFFFAIGVDGVLGLLRDEAGLLGVLKTLRRVVEKLVL
jgi:hypothetical protein